MMTHELRHAAPVPDRSREHWHALNSRQQRDAIANLARQGHSLTTIATATGVSMEQLEAFLANPEKP